MGQNGSVYSLIRCSRLKETDETWKRNDHVFELDAFAKKGIIGKNGKTSMGSGNKMVMTRKWTFTDLDAYIMVM